MYKILFLHGFFASGQCVPAVALRDAFKGRAEVITPDLPMHPKEAISFIRELIETEMTNKREKSEACINSSERVGIRRSQKACPLGGQQLRGVLCADAGFRNGHSGLARQSAFQDDGVPA